jgi:hypothetical protein
MDIAPDRWRAELESFTQQHEGWIVSVVTRSPKGPENVEAHDVHLQQVSQSSPHADRIVVEVGGPDGRLIHEVRDVQSVCMDFAPNGARRALVFETGDGSTTTIAFRSPRRPEEVDGIASISD